MTLPPKGMLARFKDGCRFKVFQHPLCPLEAYRGGAGLNNKFVYKE